MQKIGKVYLVGAGPGDIGLLTVKGRKLIEEAKVVVYDRLVSKDIMTLIKKDARLIDVGKNVGNHKVPQDRINEILLEEALAGNDVLRLKGGDPFVFGRGGEELELLVKNNVEFEVVPGITSSISVPCYAGIPVTHRDFCSSLHIITGHAKEGCELNFDFDALVRLNGTLIFMMSVKNVAQISKGLIFAGMDKEMPIAIIENGTRSNQRKFVSTLENIENVVLENNVKSPAIIMVGKVCSLSDNFDWFMKKPLKNVNILLTQPKKTSSVLAEKLVQLGANVDKLPTISTNILDDFDVNIDEYSTILFTSSVGVDSFFNYLNKKNKDARILFNKKIACVGSQTAKSLKTYGIISDFIPSVFDGVTLAKEMIEQGFVSKSDKILIPRAKIGSEEIIEVLNKENFSYLDLAVYETTFINHKDALDIAQYDYITFTSKSCVEGLVNSTKCIDFKGATAICIGRQTSEAAQKYGFNIIVSEVATINSMVDKIISLKK